MPFDRPTLEELVERVGADMKSALGITGALVRRSMGAIVAKVWGGTTHLLHGHLAWNALQLFVDTAERFGVIRIGSFYGISPLPATFAVGDVTVTGVETTAVSAGAILLRDDNARFEVTVGGVISGGTVDVTVQAELAGVAGNTEPAAVMIFESPIPDINDTAAVAAGGLIDGADEETTESLTNRILQRLRTPPTGGSDPDYIGWALEVSGVTRVWVFRHTPLLGQVTVLFVRDDEVPIIPDAGEIAAVQDKLDAERPTAAEVIADAPTPLPVTYTIALDPDTDAIRTAVGAALDDQLFRDAEPGDGLGVGTVLLSATYGAISDAEGIEDWSLDLVQGIAPADVVPALFELAERGTITWA